MSTPPPTDGMAPLVRLTRLRERYGALPRAKRELAIFGIALLFGLIAMTFLIWFAGNRVLGPYIHGQSPRARPFALTADFLLGQLHGAAVLSLVARAPAVLPLLVDLFIALLPPAPSGRGPWAGGHHL